jgi:flagellum-specific peptidoglycan hydrolase FlgJ
MYPEKPKKNIDPRGILLLVVLVGAMYYKTETERLDENYRMQVGDLYDVLKAEQEAAAPEDEMLFNVEEDFIDPWQELVSSLEEERETVETDLTGTQLAFFKRFYPTAMMEQERYKIPFSIKMSQGALEGRWGQSTLAVKANNHFGVKTKHGGYPLCDDDCNDRFKIYPSAWASWRAHSQFLTTNKRYEPLFADKFDRAAFAKYANDLSCLKTGERGCAVKGKDPKFNQKLALLEKNWHIPYKRWAYGLDLLGYATDVNYANALISLIERNGFNKHDKL